MMKAAVKRDLDAVFELYQKGVRDMKARGLNQWMWGVYPNEAILEEDVEKGQLYILKEEGAILAALAMNEESDPQYETVAWHFGQKPAMMHRLVVDPDCQGRGVGRQVMAWLMEEAARTGHDCLRLDTNLLNERAVALYESLGMHRAGQVYFDEAIPYPCFEIPVIPDCPLLPLAMTPAFRCGSATPWGGDRLGALFSKKIPDNRTGESLEVSVIPDLNSRDAQGEELEGLIARYGAALVGTAWVNRPFPLLLKLLDAKDTLSVQVHPGDGYAAAHEGGKLGKTEAWVILACREGAELVYGLRPGTTLEALEAACRQGPAVEALLRRVKVQPGDVLNIPAGCVHAIGGGITLYEIQQSSDVTYRFYDWERRDKNGNKRELHLDKALAVADLSFAGEPANPPKAPGVTRLLEEPYFTLDRYTANGALPLPRSRERFRILTALDSLLLCWENDAITLKKGQTVLLPAASPELWLDGVGSALVAGPKA